MLALLRDADLAQALGCDLRFARETLDAMDRDALVGIRIDQPLEAPPVPTREPALGTKRPTLKTVLADRLPMTPVAKRTLEASGKDVRRFDPRRVVIALLSLAPPDPASALLDALGVDRAAVSGSLDQPSAA